MGPCKDSPRPPPTSLLSGKRNSDGGSSVKEQGPHKELHGGKDSVEARRPRGEEENEGSEEKAFAAHLVHQGREGKRSG